MRRLVRGAAVWLVLGLLVGAAGHPAAAEEPPALKSGIPPELQKRIDAAMDRAVGWLSHAQRKDGSWRFYPRQAWGWAWNIGLTSLAGLALLHGGIAPEDPRIVRAKAFVKGEIAGRWKDRRKPVPLVETYSAGLTIAFLVESGDSGRSILVSAIARELADGYTEDGYWDYWPYRLTPRGRRERSRGKLGNISTTLYAVYGLRAAHHAGSSFPKDGLRLLMERLKEEQWGGAWAYDLWPGHRSRVYFNGTVAGLASYVMAGEILGVWKTRAEVLRDEVVQAALAWLERNPTPDHAPPNYRGSCMADPTYGYYAAERCGMLLGVRTFGKVDWYLQGARDLLPLQARRGAWPVPPREKGSTYGRTVTTAFGLLFFARGTRPFGPTTPAERARGRTSSRSKLPDLGGIASTTDPRLASALEVYANTSKDRRRALAPELGKAGPVLVRFLIERLDDGSVELRSAALDLLERLVPGGGPPFDPAWPRAQRRVPVAAWKRFWERGGARLRWDPKRRVFARS